jgi:outer membrane immunogenic protein
MRRLAIALLGVAAISAGGAQAADLPVKARPMAPVVAPFNWTGFYVGIHGGGDWGHIDGSYPGAGTAYSHNTSGWQFGGHLGYQYQWNQLVFGVEVGGSFVDSRGSVTCPNPTFSCEEKAQSLFEVVGKVGWAIDRVLVYGKAGWGGESIKSTTTPTFPGYDETRFLDGFLVGGGVEYAFTPNWLIGVEYMHLNLSQDRFAATPFVAGVTRDIKGDDNMVRARLSYRFGWTP